MQDAFANMTAAMKAYDAETSSAPDVISWGMQVFSADSDDAPWEHYHTATNLQKTDANYSVGPDTIYRLGSLTKILTMMTFLAEGGEQYLTTPVSHFLPQLLERPLLDPIMNTDWSTITLGNLAS
ncbi:hypothetical protein F5Y16DRAFT_260845 [Xylariaceae sp. FL0255]|nr:hypothetical protein F5Y16DRAFT_260845 [Xylariaceae sp. FL0255]